MGMRLASAGLLLGALTLIGCQDRSPVGTTTQPRAARVEGVVQRPFKGWSQGTFTLGTFCAPAVKQFSISGTGEASHIGALTVTIHGCVSLLTGDASGTPTGSITAANGDVAYMNVTSLHIDLATFGTVANYQFTGGTGRFEGVSGEMSSVGVAVAGVPGVDWTNTFSGWISY